MPGERFLDQILGACGVAGQARRRGIELCQVQQRVALEPHGPLPGVLAARSVRCGMRSRMVAVGFVFMPLPVRTGGAGRLVLRLTLRVGFGSAGGHYRQLPSCSTYACPVTGLPWYRPVTLLAPS